MGNCLECKANEGADKTKRTNNIQRPQHNDTGYKAVKKDSLKLEVNESFPNLQHISDREQFVEGKFVTLVILNPNPNYSKSIKVHPRPPPGFAWFWLIQYSTV